MVVHDEKAGLFWLINFMRYNEPENPNVLKSWVASFLDCPECALKDRIFEEIERVAIRKGGGFLEAFRISFGKVYGEGFANASPNQEQEQEQEQKQEQKHTLSVRERANSSPYTLPEKFVAPTLEDVCAFFATNNFSRNPEEFFNYYTSIGWRQGNHQIADWHATARNWEMKPQRAANTQAALPAAKRGAFNEALYGEAIQMPTNQHSNQQNEEK